MEKEEEKCTCTEECATGYNPNCTCECDECHCSEKADDQEAFKERILKEIEESQQVRKEKKEKEKKSFKKDKNADKLNDAYNKISELEDALLRSKAEFVNYRKRLDEETSRLLKYSNKDIALKILPTLDNFERAINMDDDKLNDEVSKFLSGFIMIYNSFIDVLKTEEIVEIDALGQSFNPELHQAIMTKQVEGMEPDMVASVLQKGYMLKDQVIRPAMVIVSE